MDKTPGKNFLFFFVRFLIIVVIGVVGAMIAGYYSMGSKTEAPTATIGEEI